ncbi:ATP synthase (F/14-kDa) subunit-domain-containing protein [Mrakia frigida]|uniref:H(+)-transporting V1 sector ATPase subunit F n=1 Tax=Mrakia frigida TaxID=29902 RepID=UPI003FCC04E6
MAILDSRPPTPPPPKSETMATHAASKDRKLIAVIGDEDSITGLLLAGIGHIDKGSKNFLIASEKTEPSVIEAAFQEFTERPDIAILLINQHLAEKIRPTVDQYAQAFPALLEIPSKSHPYDPSKDSVLKRVRKLAGDD